MTKDITAVPSTTIPIYKYTLFMIFSLMSLKNKPCDTYISNEYFPHRAKNELLIIGVLLKMYEQKIVVHTKKSELIMPKFTFTLVKRVKAVNNTPLKINSIHLCFFNSASMLFFA